MPKRYFNWKLAVVLLIGLAVLGITAYGLRTWQRSQRAEKGLEAGNRAYKNHNWQQAADYLGRYLAVKHDEIAVLLKYADAQLKIRPLKRNNLIQAIAAYRNALILDKDNSEAAKQLTKIYLELDMPGEAELIAKRQLGRLPSTQEQPEPTTQSTRHPELQRILAVAMAKQRKFDEAAAELKSLIAKHPEQILAYETLGRLCENRPDDFPHHPEHWFNEAIKNNPSSALAYIIRADFYLRNQNKSQASNDLKQAEKMDLSDTLVRLRLAMGFINTDKPDKAEQHLAVLQESEPTNPALWQNWARLALTSRSKKKMLAIAENGLKFSAQPLDFMPRATELFIQAGEYDRAADCIGKLRQKDIAPANTAFLEGLAANAQGKLHEAIKCWQRAIQLGDKSTRIRLALASALSRTGNIKTALRRLRTLVSERPDSFEGRLALSRLLARAENWSETAEQTHRAMQLSPEKLEPVLLNLRAEIQLLTEKQIEQNSPAYRNITNRLNKLDKGTRNALEVKILKLALLMRQNNFNDAEALISQLKKSYPSELKVALAEAELLNAEQKQQQAISVLNKSIQEFPQSVQPVKFAAALTAQQGNHEKCETIIKDALARIESPAASRELGLMLAEFYTSWQEQDKAYQFLTALAQKMPQDIPVKQRLLRCQQITSNPEQAGKIVEHIKALEGQDGWQWRYEQARLWFETENFKNRYPQIVSSLKENLFTNPEDQASRKLLAATYQRAGQLRLAISTYEEALARSPEDIDIIIHAVATLYRAQEFDRADQILRRTADEKLYHPKLKKLQLQSLLRKGKLDSACNILEEMLLKDPNNRSACLTLALLKMQQNKYPEADRLLEKLKIQEPNSLQLTAAQVELNLRQGNPAKALQLCNTIVNNFNNASVHILRARTYARLGQNDKAIQDFEHATAIEPNNVSTWLAKSDFYKSTDQPDKAAADIKKALSLAPDNIQIRKQAISMFLSSENPDRVRRAKTILEQALESNPEDIELRLFKARSLLAKGTAPAMEKASQVLEKITEDQPRATQAWALLGELLLRQGRPAKAIDIALRGLVHQFDNKSLLLLKARAEAAGSLPALAIPTLKAILEIDPNDAYVVIRLANTYIDSDSAQKAVKLLKAQLPSHRGTSSERKIDIALAVALYKNGNKEEAKKKFDSLYRSAPDDPAPLLAQVSVLKDERLWNQLSRQVFEWCGKNPDDTDTPVNIAGNLTATGNSEAQKTAENILRRTLKRHPNSLSAMNTLAMLLQMTERIAEATALYQESIKIQPDNIIAINNLAWIMCDQQGKPQQALKLAQRGLKLAPDYIDLIDTRGVIYCRLGEYNKAVKDFDRCLKLYGENSPAAVASRFHLGKALAGLGQKEKAAQNLKKTLELNAKIGGLSPTDVAETQRMIKDLLEGT